MNTEIKRMTVLELKERIDNYLQMRFRDGAEVMVCIPNNKGGMGGTSVTYVNGAHGGIDWDASKFFIRPEVKMIERPPDFTETDFQEALGVIRYLMTQLDVLIRSAEGDAKYLPLRIKHAKQVLEITNKNKILKIK